MSSFGHSIWSPQAESWFLVALVSVPAGSVSSGEQVTATQGTGVGGWGRSPEMAHEPGLRGVVVMATYLPSLKNVAVGAPS